MHQGKNLNLNMITIMFFMLLSFSIISLVSSFALFSAPPDGELAMVPHPILPSAAGDKWDRITIIANGDIPTYADSGNGTIGDPWIICDYVIDCNGTGSGIFIQNTNEYITIINCSVNESGTGATDACIGFGYASNIRVEDSTLNAAGGKYAFGDFYGDNIIVDNVSLANSSENNIYLYETINSQFTNINSTNSTGVNIFVTGVAGDPHDLLFDNINATNATYNANAIVHLSKGYNQNITNSIFTNATGGLEPKGIRINSDDVVIENCTIQYIEMAIYMFGNDNATIIGNTILGTLDGIHAQAGNSNNHYIAYNTVGSQTDPNWGGDCFAFTNCDNNTFYNNTLYASLSNSTDSGFSMRNCDNDVIENNYMEGFGSGIQYTTTSSTNLTIYNNTIVNCTNYGLELRAVSTVNITGNTFINNTVGFGESVIRIDASNVNITSNNFTNNTNCIGSTSSSLNVNYNYFNDDNDDLMSGVYNNFSQNYYQDYFDQNPYAITFNSSTEILNESYLVDSSFNDTEPLYYEDWFPRDETVSIGVISLVDGKGIFLEYITIYLDGVAQTSKTFTISYVLYHLKIASNGATLIDQVYNINGTGTEFYVYVELANQIYFSFYSLIDGFGLPFYDVKLHINDTRVTTNQPMAIESYIHVKITDFLFNITLYDEDLDLKDTGVYLDIGLLIAPIIINNKYDRPVIFYLSRNGIETTITMGSSSDIGPLRFAVGTYTYIVTELNGTELLDKQITFESDDPGNYTIEFGFTEVPVGDTIVQNNLNIFVLIATFGIFTAIVIFVTFRGIPLPTYGTGKTKLSNPFSSSPRKNNPRKSKKKGYYEKVIEKIKRS